MRDWGTPDQATGQFTFPTGIAADAAGNVYVADNHNFVIQKFTTNGAFVRSYGTYGPDDGDIRFARGVAVSPDSTIYVADSVNDRVQVFR
ncbi:MAG: hypothetical protein FJ319_07990 [SAR202 cluster bacterium]|nr:hypothetical protein [SAR202 cluster bacterium]